MGLYFQREQAYVAVAGRASARLYGESTDRIGNSRFFAASLGTLKGTLNEHSQPAETYGIQEAGFLMEDPQNKFPPPKINTSNSSSSYSRNYDVNRKKSSRTTPRIRFHENYGNSPLYKPGKQEGTLCCLPFLCLLSKLGSNNCLEKGYTIFNGNSW